MTDEPLYRVGDLVRVKDLTTLKDELGDPISAQCGWFGEEMDRYAGAAYKVAFVHYANCGRTQCYVYRLEGAGDWWFSEDVLENQLDSSTTEDRIHQSMSYEEAMGIL